eukprot:421144-Alexandrium_andersonii.AAC.1
MSKSGMTSSDSRLRAATDRLQRPMTSSDSRLRAATERLQRPMTSSDSRPRGAAGRNDGDFLVLRTRNARQHLAALRDGSATGPDALPARILR